MDVSYRTDIKPAAKEVIGLYKSAGLIRPIDDAARIQKMYDESDLVITAWDGDLFVGVARALTDFCYCCYLSDLAVRKEYQSKGIGKTLIEMTKEIIGDQTMLLLLSAPAAMDYYPRIGMEKVTNGFIIKRLK